MIRLRGMRGLIRRPIRLFDSFRIDRGLWVVTSISWQDHEEWVLEQLGAVLARTLFVKGPGPKDYMTLEEMLVQAGWAPPSVVTPMLVKGEKEVLAQEDKNGH